MITYNMINCWGVNGMLGSIINVSTQVFILMILIGTGFLCGKIRLFNDASIQQLSSFVLKVVAPCAIIESLYREFDVATLFAMLRVMVIAAAVYLLSSILSYAFIRGGGRETVRVLRFGVIFGNCGYMGLPLLQVLFGADGMLYGASYILVYNIVQWTFGLFVISGDRKEVRPAKLLNPALMGVAIGLAIFLTSIKLPEIIFRPVSYFSALNVPVPMVITGYYLSKADLKAIWKHVEYYKTILLRLVIVPLIAILALRVTGFDSVLLISCVVSASVPVAAATTMLATVYHQDAETAANIVSISTILSMITLPLSVAFAQFLFGAL